MNKAGTGGAKARTSAQARAAVQARWEKHRKTKRGPRGGLAQESQDFCKIIAK
jgi:hypothetical protein